MPEQKSEPRVYRSLWPLPGGHGHFLGTLLEILDWIADRQPPTYAALYAWMRQRYSLRSDASTPDGYIQVIARMGYIASKREGMPTLTLRGKTLVHTRDVHSVLDALMQECLGTYDVLATVGKLGAANGRAMLSHLHQQYPYWDTPAQFDWRLQWLHSLGCLEKVEDGYVITPIGRQAVIEYAAAPTQNIYALQSAEVDHETEQHIDEPEGIHENRISKLQDESHRLADRLQSASLESDDATGFELVLAEAFRFLGYRAQHRGGSGDTDVLVTALLGQETYRAIVDGKSSRHGRVSKQQIDWYALDRHKSNHNADYMLVVAPGFSSGDLLDNAAKANTALITAEDLAAVIRLHAQTPLSLADMRELFRYSGQPELPLQRIQEKAAEVARLQQLLPDIIKTFEYSYNVGVSAPIAADALHLILARDYGRAIYTKEEIIAALDLLCTPLIGALRKVAESTYSLQMPMASCARRFQAQAMQLHNALDLQDSGILDEQSASLR